MTRQRHVWPNNIKLLLAWRSQQLAYGRNRSGSLFFEGPVLYSYGKHWAVARIDYHLVNSGRYSVTSTRHAQDASWKLQHVVRVPCIEPVDHGVNVAYLKGEVLAWLWKMVRARVPYAVDPAKAAQDDLHAYCRRFALDTPDILLPEDLKRRLALRALKGLPSVWPPQEDR